MNIRKKISIFNPGLRFSLGCNFIALIVIILSITMGASTYYNLPPNSVVELGTQVIL